MGIPKIILKKSFELGLYDKSGTLVVMLLLSLFEANKAMEK